MDEAVVLVTGDYFLSVGTHQLYQLKSVNEQSQDFGKTEQILQRPG